VYQKDTLLFLSSTTFGYISCQAKLLPSCPMKIVSGGQTGVDRAALDAALELGIPCGGWCPRGRRSEDGTIPEKYPLKQSSSSDYRQRTEWNVRDSDGTLIITVGPVSGGTALTVDYACKHKRPCYVVDLETEPDPIAIRGFIDSNQIQVLNVAEPRESKVPGICDRATGLLRRVLG